MAHHVTEVDEFTTPITVADGMDTHSTMSSVVAAFVQALANRTKHLLTHGAKVDAANVFTAPNNTFQDLTVAGTAHMPSVTGSVYIHSGLLVVDDDIHANVDVGADHNVHAGNDSLAAGEFLYDTPRALRIAVSPVDFTPGSAGASWNLAGANADVAPGGTLHYILRPPHGGVLGQVRLLLNTRGGDANYTITLYRRWGVSYSSPVSVSREQRDTQDGTVAIAVGAMQREDRLDWNALTTDRAESYEIYVNNHVGSPGTMEIHALEYACTVKGPHKD